MASDGFAGLFGPNTRGMFIAYYGIPNAELPPPGKQFLAELEAWGGEAGPDASAVYGAQAAEIMLDAIARSDGTRASVARELFETRIEAGMLGDIRFDPLRRSRRGARDDLSDHRRRGSGRSGDHDDGKPVEPAPPATRRDESRNQDRSRVSGFPDAKLPAVEGRAGLTRPPAQLSLQLSAGTTTSQKSSVRPVDSLTSSKEISVSSEGSLGVPP